MEQENATQPGAFESGSSARSNAMAQIAARVNQDYAPDLAAFNEDTGEITAPEQTAQTTEPEQQETQAQAAQTEQAQDDLETIVIDGQERKVKRDQVLDAGRRTLQKEAAADRRLEEAAETLRRAQAYERGLMQRQPSQDAGHEQSPSSDATNGTGEQSRQATPELIGTLIEERLWMHDANKAAQRFRDEYKDIADDPLAARLVAQLENERLQLAASEGKSLGDPWEAYKSHGDKVREWLGKTKQPGGVQVSADKAERKRDTVTVTGSTSRTPNTGNPKPPTTAELIEQMRKSRQGRQIQPSR